MAWTEISDKVKVTENTGTTANNSEICECLCAIKQTLLQILECIETKEEGSEVVAYNERKYKG